MTCMITEFQLVLLSSTYDSISNPLRLDDPYGHKLLNSRQIGCRWRYQDRWVTFLHGFPEHTRSTIDASPLPGNSGVAVVELEKETSDNAILLAPDGTERLRLRSPFGPFLNVGYENGRFGFTVIDDAAERWICYDVERNSFGESHPVR